MDNKLYIVSRIGNQLIQRSRFATTERQYVRIMRFSPFVDFKSATATYFICDSFCCLVVCYTYSLKYHTHTLNRIQGECICIRDISGRRSAQRGKGVQPGKVDVVRLRSQCQSTCTDKVAEGESGQGAHEIPRDNRQ